ncbi:MAG: inorganic diphosphatase [Flavobacteriales bacterium]|jgi:inorganic pyrophosphatase|nr:inorganic diphosphatase [Flavobacteriales bacterium]MCB0757206.1 inorganic diphosphatase [Flavobacteriales bacterium]
METRKFNPWHDVELGPDAPDVVQAIIEISKGSKAKYELDKASGMLRLDRVLYSSVHYPANYGFMPRTLGDDHDPLDILVLSQIDIQPMCIARAKVIGVMRMLDNGEGDDKLIAVAADDISMAHVKGIEDLPEHVGSEIIQFFREYKRLENKTVEVEELQDEVVAKEILRKAITDYNAAYPANS